MAAAKGSKKGKGGKKEQKPLFAFFAPFALFASPPDLYSLPCHETTCVTGKIPLRENFS
jgi:hypothetical protein